MKLVAPKSQMTTVQVFSGMATCSFWAEFDLHQLFILKNVLLKAGRGSHGAYPLKS